jgi:5-methyltetrahydrofolate--homocysteine methyltransferase
MNGTLIIGERLNSSIASSRAILEARDERALLELAGRQVAAGAVWLDINASMLRGAELETIRWAAQAVLDHTPAGVCADSPDEAVLRACAAEFGDRCLLNSITAEEETLRSILPEAAGYGSAVVVMLKTSAGIPPVPGERAALARRAADIADEAGIPPDRLFLDPVLQPIATGADMQIVLQTLDLLAGEFPDRHRVGGLSNVSFGLPMRRLVNRTFLALAVSRGLTAAICDPTDQRLLDVLAAAEALSGLDPGCRRLLRHYRGRGRTGE